MSLFGPFRGENWLAALPGDENSTLAENTASEIDIVRPQQAKDFRFQRVVT